MPLHCHKLYVYMYMPALWTKFRVTSVRYKVHYVRPEVFAATELDKIFSGIEPRQMNYKIQRFGDQLHLHNPGDANSHHPNDGDDCLPEKTVYSTLCFLSVCGILIVKQYNLP